MRFYICLCCLYYATFINGQSTLYPILNIPVQRNNIPLQNPWAGGLNAPEFSAVDLNGDGLQDLFIFDRSGYKVLTFLNTGGGGDTAFKYAPGYEKLFPPMKPWAQLRDYNNDGIADIFTAQLGETGPNGNVALPGIKVYKGERVNGQLHYQPVQYSLYYSSPPYTPSIWVSNLGLPGLADVNHDGDLDILTFNLYGTEVAYYENQTRELNLPYDSLRFIEVTACWGGFYASTSGNGIALNVSCKSEAGLIDGTGAARHNGAVLWVMDNGNNGVTDLLIADSHLPSLTMLNNGGDSSYAHINLVDTLWPACNHAANMPNFPAAFRMDADNDGLEDILVAPNFAAGALDVNNVQLYKNHFTNTCNYQYTGTDSFLAHTMLDFGTDSKPVFFDADGDGLADIIAGNYYAYNPLVPGISTLAYYRNTGSATAPQYQLAGTDYAALSNYNTGPGRLAFNPAFGDLDGDGLKDLLIGDAGGNLHFLKNTGGTAAVFNAVTQPNYFSLNVGAYAAPFIYDLNADGLNDLVVGKQNGRINYYWNFGTTSAAQFSADSVNNNLGMINVTGATATEGYSQPYITADSAGNIFLFSGSNNGGIYKYLVDTEQLRSGTFTQIDSDFLHTSVGAKSTIQIADLNGDSLPEYLAGNARGGLNLFSAAVWDTTPVLAVTGMQSRPLAFYPNPASQYLTVKTTTPVQVFDVLGNAVTIPFTLRPNETVISTGHLPNGLYLLRSNAGSAKFVINH